MELDAPSHWNCIDFISDLHLQASDPLTFQAWKDYLHDTQANAVFILGDLFEVWVGDDILSLPSSFEAHCAEVLSAASTRIDLYLMHGNRDFLMGSQLMDACGSKALDDPTILTFANQRWLLTHGDAWCLDDTAYLKFREQVRGQQWQHAFLSKPLDERIDIARSLRQQSDARKQTQTTYADVDTATATAQMASERASHIIHGHTHRPARHPMGQGSERLVLSDWDMAAMPPRGEVLRLRRSVLGVAESFTVERIPPAMAARSSQATPTPVD
ncbi:MAG TPA: UDP-2,3-diacylglucosamine diphosphatase [Rhodoferax sp.]|jgi:UDP-2,3-diacylglucosamine hydrolase|nr:UDP-2,3-diacylglucosamine diphosphatase [Rhodoferax sp.]HNV59104.1 UDP-2,3-diacylglucosamine diphosphatase [Rhodoferax sp.]